MQRTVTASSSPAFQIIRVLIGILVLEAENVSPLTTDEVDEILMLALQKLQLVFASGDALPIDITPHGQTLLSYFLGLTGLSVCIMIKCNAPW